jgi:hypothetical protein
VLTGRRRGCAWVLALLAVAPSARAQFKQVEADRLRLIYLDPTETFLAPHAVRTFENSLRFHRNLWGWEPWDKRVTVLLTDFSDAGNAGATSVPRDYLTVSIAPLSFALETMAANERMNTIMNHELVHVMAMDQAAGRDRFFRHLFAGKVSPIADQPESILYFYLTTPRVAAPRWYHEGIAVFLDTWMAGGIGRAQGAYDEMVFRSMVKDGSRFYDPLGLASEGTKIDFQLQINSYLYGARFMTDLARRYGPEKLVAWVSRHDGSSAYFATQFRKVFGKSLDAAWADWVADEHVFQQKNLDAIRRYPITPTRDLSARALGSVSRAFLDPDNGRIYAAFNYPGVVAHVGAISLADGSVSKLEDIKGPSIYTVTSLAWDPKGRQLFYTADNDAYRDLRVLSPDTGRSRTLVSDARIGDIAWSPSDGTLWGIRHLNGICTLVRLQPPFKEWKSIHAWPYGEVAYDLDVSPDGALVSASVGEITGRNTLRVMKTEALLNGDAKPYREVEFGTSIPSNFVFTADSRQLYGSSYYTGASNVFRYDVEPGEWKAVSNVETGLFRPIPVSGDDVIAFRYTGAGWVPTRFEAKPLEDVSPITFFGQQVVEEHPVLKSWSVGAPPPLSVDTAHARDYRWSNSIKLESLFPIVAGYKDSVSYGMRVNFSDPIQLHRASLTAAYSPDSSLPSEERFHAVGEWQKDDWTLTGKYNAADFYDLFGPTKTSRKGYAFGAEWDHTLVFDEPRRLNLEATATYYRGLDTLPDFQNVSAPFSELFSADATLDFENVRSSLGHVDDEKGVRWSLVAAADRANGTTYPKGYATLDLGVALPIRHSSLWLRSSAGAASGDRDDPFANFFFGGFGNNWVDHGNEKRYREWYAFPGVELNDVGGRNFVRSTLEWNLPPVRFRRAGNPGFYATWLRPAVFAGGLVTNVDASAERRTLADVGAQLDIRLTLIHALDMTLSVGGAAAFEDGRAPRREFMASLKVLR